MVFSSYVVSTWLKNCEINVKLSKNTLRKSFKQRDDKKFTRWHKFANDNKISTYNKVSEVRIQALLLKFLTFSSNFLLILIFEN